MNNFKMVFSHPIKGEVRIYKRGEKCAAHIIDVDTKESRSLDVSLMGIAKGKWELMLNWKYDEKQYSYKRSISIT